MHVALPRWFVHHAVAFRLFPAPAPRKNVYRLALHTTAAGAARTSTHAVVRVSCIRSSKTCRHALYTVQNFMAPCSFFPSDMCAVCFPPAGAARAGVAPRLSSARAQRSTLRGSSRSVQASPSVSTRPRGCVFDDGLCVRSLGSARLTRQHVVVTDSLFLLSLSMQGLLGWSLRRAPLAAEAPLHRFNGVRWG